MFKSLGILFIDNSSLFHTSAAAVQEDNNNNTETNTNNQHPPRKQQHHSKKSTHPSVSSSAWTQLRQKLLTQRLQGRNHESTSTMKTSPTRQQQQCYCDGVASRNQDSEYQKHEDTFGQEETNAPHTNNNDTTTSQLQKGLLSRGASVCPHSLKCFMRQLKLDREVQKQREQMEGSKMGAIAAEKENDTSNTTTRTKQHCDNVCIDMVRYTLTTETHNSPATADSDADALSSPVLGTPDHNNTKHRHRRRIKIMSSASIDLDHLTTASYESPQKSPPPQEHAASPSSLSSDHHEQDACKQLSPLSQRGKPRKQLSTHKQKIKQAVTHLVILDSQLKRLKELPSGGAPIGLRSRSPIDKLLSVLRSQWYRTLTKMNIKIVKESWITESIRSGYQLNDEEFTVHFESDAKTKPPLRVDNSFVVLSSEEEESVVVKPTKIRKRKRRRLDLSGKPQKKVRRDSVPNEPTASMEITSSVPSSYQSDAEPCTHALEEKNAPRRLVTCDRVSQSSFDDDDIVSDLTKRGKTLRKSTKQRGTFAASSSSVHDLFSHFSHLLNRDPFHACTFYFSSTIESSTVRELSIRLFSKGATVMPVLNSRVTHMILASSLEDACELSSDEYKFVHENELHLITLKGVTTSLENNQMVSPAETKYFVPPSRLSDKRINALKQRVRSTNVFLARSFTLHLDASSRADMKFLIEYCSGLIVDDLEQHDKDVNYMVSNWLPEDLNTQSAKVEAYVTTDFVMDCIENGHIYNLDSPNAPFYWKPVQLKYLQDVYAWKDVFENTKDIKGVVPEFCVAGLSKPFADKVTLALRNIFGCATKHQLDSETCDVLLVDPEQTPTELITEAQEHSIRLVHMNWINTCAQACMFLSLDADTLDAQTLIEKRTQAALDQSADTFTKTLFESSSGLSTLNTSNKEQSMPPLSPSGIEPESPSDSNVEAGGYVSDELDADDEDRVYDQDYMSDVLKFFDQAATSSMKPSNAKNVNPEAAVNREMMRRNMTPHVAATLPLVTQNVILAHRHQTAADVPSIFLASGSPSRRRMLQEQVDQLQWHNADKVEDCTHVVYVDVPKSVRTYSALMYLASQKYLVKEEWLTECHNKGTLVKVEPEHRVGNEWTTPPFEGWIVYAHGWRSSYSRRLITILECGGAMFWNGSMNMQCITHILSDNAQMDAKEKELYHEIKKKVHVEEYKVTRITKYLHDHRL